VTLEDDVAAWKAAKSVKDLGELTARWLEGDVKYQPGYFGEPAEETIPLVEFLASVNRAGFYTTNSQPGEPIKDWSGQRACVEGFCQEQLAKKISSALLKTDLVMIATPPGAASDVQICITIDDDKECTWVGGPTELGPIVDLYDDELDALALAALLTAWQVCIIDPVWGRNDLLWTRLVEAIQ